MLITHDSIGEMQLVANGRATHRRSLMYNDFVVIGPPDDPARIKAEPSAAAALKKIAATGSRFVSRGDKSGTHSLELALWSQAGVTPAAPWYIESGQGMGATLGIADDRHELSALAKLPGQIFAAGILYLSGVAMSFFWLPVIGVISLSPDVSAIATILWIVLLTNAVNYSDGLDGLAAGLAAIAGVGVFFYSLLLPPEFLGPVPLAPLVAVTWLAATLLHELLVIGVAWLLAAASSMPARGSPPPLGWRILAVLLRISGDICRSPKRAPCCPTDASLSIATIKFR